MIILLKRICAFLLVLFLPITAFAAPISVSAQSAIVINSADNSVIYSKNAYSSMPMASTTKIMTCVLACESTRLNDTVVITNEMLAGTEGSLIYLKPDDKITLYDLTVAAMLASGNDAANAVAFCLSGSIADFVALMNKKACSIGMKNTFFVTPSGLDEKNHHSTAYDMALLASYAMKNSCFSKICALKSAQITINGKKQTVYNHNKLLSSDNNFVGVKTGFTEKAGRCLVSAYNYNGNMIITVTLNAPDDWQDHKRLVAFAKKQFTTKKDNKTFALDVVGAPKNTVQCGYEYNVTVYKNLDIRLYYYPFVYAPLKCGDTVGECKIYSNNRLIKTVDITVRENINYGE